MTGAIDPDRARAMLAAGATTRVAASQTPPRYAVGDAVRARNLNPLGHTRLPRYIRGRRGTIAKVHGVFALPDARAAGRAGSEQYCYSVRFAAPELWGPEGKPGDLLYIDLFDDYLMPG